MQTKTIVRRWAVLVSALLAASVVLGLPPPHPPAAAAAPPSIARVDVGVYHTCILLSTGGVRCWGWNGQGELGNGSVIERGVPNQVFGLGSGVASIATGSFHTCVVTTTGTPRCWGSNGLGELGTGSSVNASVPVRVSGLAGDVAKVAADWGHTCAVTTAGGVKCWGIYDPPYEGGSPVPQDVPGLASGVVDVAVGSEHACALTTAGGVRCWGSGWLGQLGDGTYDNSDTPVDVVGLSSGVVQIAATGSRTCALTGAGAVRCWGEGPLGNGTDGSSPTPVDVVGLSSGVVQITSTCALTGAGGAMCWGSNEFGQLGDGTTTDSLVPVPVAGLSSGVTQIASGGYHACALLADGGLRCWGSNLRGELGEGTTRGRRLQPVAVVDYGPTPHPAPTSVSVASERGIIAGGKVAIAGQLASPHPACRSSRTLEVDRDGEPWRDVVTGAGGDYRFVATIRKNTVIQLTFAGDLDCEASTSEPWEVEAYHWEGEASRRAGVLRRMADPAPGPSAGDRPGGHMRERVRPRMSAPPPAVEAGSLAPAPAAATNADAVQVSAGDYHTCAVLAGGGVRCWGANWSGQLGDGTLKYRPAPVPVKGLPPSVQVSAGESHTCALTITGAVWCWGSNRDGLLGNGSTRDSSKPVPVSGLSSGVVAISANIDHTCAVLSDDRLRCWGIDWFGDLGTGDGGDTSVPMDAVALPPVTSVAAGAGHTCALTDTGRLRCWGWGYWGQLGLGSDESFSTPVRVSGLPPRAATIVTGSAHTCVLTVGGAVWCWGGFRNGEAGLGQPWGVVNPAKVRGLDAGVAGISSTGEHTCAVKDDGQVRCWGWNGRGQLGDGTRVDRFAPVAVAGLGDGVRAVAAGLEHTCALTDAGGVECWGDARFGQLGNGTTAEWSGPVAVWGLGPPVSPTPRVLSLAAPERVVRGTKALVTGRLSSPDAACVASKAVKVRVGATETHRVITNGWGGYRLAFEVTRRKTAVKVTIARAGGCAAASSPRKVIRGI